MQLPKSYDPSLYEADIYALWEKSQSFAPRGTGQSYAVVMPPPNANGNLHIGHGLTIAIEDILIRHHRMLGENVLFIPGADHAGFETWVVYEKELAKEGKSRFDFSREDLYQQVWDFVARNRQNFEAQIRRLGASVDWQHYTFTLDDHIIKQAYATFKQMWDEGLIYRGERLVNFCTFHGTGFADIEVVYKEEPGKLWYLKYPLVDGSGEVIVATTRPETMLGDTAVAVHPEDNRYAAFVGKTIRLPITGREVPIIADSFVDQAFGTGAVKITPAHDINDYDAGKRHNLPMIKVIDHEGKLTSDMPKAYRGLDVDSARKKIIVDLENLGVLEKTEDHVHSVGHCYKCDTTIQPLLREQWFVGMQELSGKAITTLKADKITFHPSVKQEQLVRYLQGLRDWNISRQIAWGIPIPAFQNIDEPDDWIYDERVDEALIQVGEKTYRRDPDVFDTWFSSSSWPYATLNYPDNDDFKTYYPISVMDTGTDILYPWVSRMLMFGLYVTGEIPFETVYLHGLIQDEHGQKMSKSKGNVVNPIEKVTSFGSDAFRMGIISDEAAASNRPYDESKLVGARNFCNKLWNIARYVEPIIGESPDRSTAQPITVADHWIVSRLNAAAEAVAKALDNYHFGEAYESLYHFVWDECADWYIEASKAEPNIPLLAYLLEAILLLAHPFAPFLTETIWQTLAWEKESVLASRTYAEPLSFNENLAASFTEIQRIIVEVRSISKALKLNHLTLSYHDVPFLKANAPIIERMAKLKAVKEVPDGSGLNLTTTTYRCWLDINKATALQYVSELKAKQEELLLVINQLKKRLGNTAYLEKAPKRIVVQTEQQLESAEQLLESLKREYARFNQD